MRRRFLAATAVCLFAALGVGARDAPAASTTCTGEIQGVTIITGNLVAGPGCYLDDAVTVNGNVVVRTGGSLDTFSSTINGNVTSHGATSVSLGYTLVNGNVEIVGSTEGAGVWRSTIVGNVLLKKNSGFGVEESRVSGNMKVSQNTADASATAYFDFDGVGGNFDISNNRGDIRLVESGTVGNLDIRSNRGDIQLTITYAGGMDIRNNRGAIALAGNTIIGILNCQNNRPPVTVGDENTAGTAKGECAGVPSAAAPAA